MNIAFGLPVKTSNNISPVALFVYKRPQHTLRTLEALQNNLLADQTHLYVFSDGPRNIEDEEKVAQVRRLVKKKRWCAETTIINRDRNLGLAANIRNGIDEILSKYDRIIVLEDDIETSPGFLSYMNNALAVYVSDPLVMNISGYVPETSYQWKLPETFFVRLVACWGWGTWRRAWQYARWDAFELLLDLERRVEGIKDFDIDHTYPFSQQLRDNLEGRLNTWAVFWAASSFLLDGITLFPNRSLIRNIGLDGTGENCTSGQDSCDKYRCAPYIKVKRIPIKESSIGRNYFKAFHRYGQNSSYVRRISVFLKQIRHSILKVIPEPIKEPLREILRKEHPFGLAHSNRERLIRSPRFRETTVELYKRPLKIIDAASFLASHDEIFCQEIYRFTSSLYSPVVVDVGANIGMASIYFHRLYPGVRIIAIESDPMIVDILDQNLKSFGITNTEIIHGAAWDRDKPLQFKSDHADGGRVMTGEKGRSSVFTVPGVRLKNIIKNKQVEMLKVDIEGAEIRVIRDCEDVLKNVKHIFIEFHSIADQPQELSILLSVLERSGFRYYIQQTGIYNNHPLTSHAKESGFDLQLNIFGRRGKL